MEDLIDFVSEKAKLPLPAARNATSATLEYLTPRFSPLLKSNVEVMLHHPHLSDAIQKSRSRKWVTGFLLFPLKLSKCELV